MEYLSLLDDLCVEHIKGYHPDSYNSRKSWKFFSAVMIMVLILALFPVAHMLFL